VAEGLLRRLGGGWGAVKYTKTAFYTSVTDASETASQENKDSTRLLKAGAARCLWVQAPPHELKDALSMALDHMGGLDGVIVEGNAPLDCTDFDAVIFVFGRDASRFKESAEKPLLASDIIVFAGVSDAPDTGREIRGRTFCAPSLYNSGGDSNSAADGGAQLDAIYTALVEILGPA
jgi:hypothetical protein